MAFLDEHSQPMTALEAAHLLRRASFGGTPEEVNAFTGLTPLQAYNQLLANASAPTGPVYNLDETAAGYGTPLNFSDPFDSNFNFQRYVSLRNWWIGLMCSQSKPISLLEKLSLFWQNHFVVAQGAVSDNRFLWVYLNTIRSNSLGNFKTFVRAITLDPAMLRYLNGNESTKTSPNENYSREVQELFVVGQHDFYGNPNYNENDVKEGAKLLTGWRSRNSYVAGSTSVDSYFTLSRHDITNKTFSAYYNNTIINGVNASDGGDVELTAFINMLLAHPHSAKNICRKLYRWYVSATVTEEIENNVILPLANFFSSAANDWNIEPVIQKLLCSQVFFSSQNRGAIIKAPTEFIIGCLRHFKQPVPDAATDAYGFDRYCNQVYNQMKSLALDLLDQSSVFGYEPYYQDNRSKGWLSTASLALRYKFIDLIVYPTYTITTGYKLGIQLVSWIASLQPNFSDTAGTPAITCEEVLAALSDKLFALPLTTNQQNFLIDSVMMQGIPRSSWQFEWNRYRSAPTVTDNINAVKLRLSNLMKYMLRMAEYQIH